MIHKKQFGFLTLVFTISMSMIYLSGYGNNSIQITKQQAKKISNIKSLEVYITEEDLDFFSSTIIDYLGDFEDFSRIVETLSISQTNKLYQKIEFHIETILLKKQPDLFLNQDQKNKWICQEIHKIRLLLVKNIQKYLQDKIKD